MILRASTSQLVTIIVIQGRHTCITKESKTIDANSEIAVTHSRLKAVDIFHAN